MILSERQKEILEAIIKEYLDNASEVGSNLLADKYHIPASPATIRNEMMKLNSLGYLAKSHVSSGRIPTDLALRLYFKELVDEDILDPLEDVEIKKEIFKERFNRERLLNSVLEIVSESADSASFVMLEDWIRYHGLSKLMRFTELKQVQILERIFDLLEDSGLLQKILSKYQGEEEICLLIGEETGIEELSFCSLAFTYVPLWNGELAYYGVIGSKRINYPHVISVMRKVKGYLFEALKGWR